MCLNTKLKKGFNSAFLLTHKKCENIVRLSINFANTSIAEISDRFRLSNKRSTHNSSINNNYDLEHNR